MTERDDAGSMSVESFYVHMASEQLQAESAVQDGDIVSDGSVDGDADTRRVLKRRCNSSNGDEKVSDLTLRPAKRRTPPWSAMVDVLTRICAMLPRPDLKNVTLVCRCWANAARPILFRTVFLRISLQSFERLQEIARHNTLRKYVRKISYDGRTLDGRAAREGFQVWLTCRAGTGLGLDWKATRELVSRVDVKELERCYSNYLCYLFGQEYILRRSNEKEMLVNALQKLPGLEAIQYVVPRDMRPSRIAPPLDSLSPSAREILAEPQDYPGYRESEGHFWTLLQSACLSGHAQQLRTVQGSRLDLERWNAAAAESLSDCYEALPNLEQLSLEFDFAQRSDGDAAMLARIIARVLGLESLRLSFDEFSWDHPHAVIHLPQVIDETIRWEYLRRLSLQAVATTEGCLRSLLQRHARSLRSLELSNIKFEDAAIPNQDRRGSWIQFIHFLRQTLSLEHVRFNGCFSNSWNEAWITRDADDERLFDLSGVSAPYPDDCLKYRIERFVTHGGVSPFTARTVKDYENMFPYYNLPWTFDEDRSWSFAPPLIQ
ncbi:hypothetical protein V1517DRAFT_159991 [Lipomyces orientalis]|uniref:Uncharacterized protein n=1 Tax=Lipomyces orientalis TaxID=1233043 RepID=A0ACC3TLB0_9ASCO